MRDIILGILGYDNIHDLVLRDLQWALNNRSMLERESFPREVLGYIVEVIVTRGYWRTWPMKYLIWKLKSMGFTVTRNHVVIGLDDFDKLLKAVDELYRETHKRYWYETLSGLQAFSRGIRRAGSLKKWIDTLHSLLVKGYEWKKHEYYKGIRGLGRKGSELILRDMGYFDRIPVDIHERRFILRTGIALLYGPPSKDPISLEFYIEALTRYSRENLEDVELGGVALGSAPGILDWAIWYFACEKESGDCKAICSSDPKCEKCPIRNACLYGKISGKTG